MSKKDKTDVLILGTLHKMHKLNENYSYDDIFSIIDRFNPDVIGVEIRMEDISQPREYLDSCYPYEMIEAVFRYRDTHSVYGFDWLGSGIEGKPIPAGYFETLDVKVLERKFDAAEGYEKEKSLIEIIDKIRMPLIMDKTAVQCNNGNYDTAVDIFYSQLECLLKDTPFEKMCRFYRERDSHIDSSMIDIVKNNAGCRIIFLTGLDHRVFAAESLRGYFKDDITIREITDL